MLIRSAHALLLNGARLGKERTMVRFRSTALGRKALSDVRWLARLARFSPVPMLLALTLTSGCAGLSHSPGQIAAEDNDAQFSQAMRMAESVRANGDMSAAAVFFAALTPLRRTSSNRSSGSPSRPRRSAPKSKRYNSIARRSCSRPTISRPGSVWGGCCWPWSGRISPLPSCAPRSPPSRAITGRT